MITINKGLQLHPFVYGYHIYKVYKKEKQSLFIILGLHKKQFCLIVLYPIKKRRQHARLSMLKDK